MTDQQFGHLLAQAQAQQELAAIVRGLTEQQWLEISNDIAAAIFSAPPGVDRAEFLRAVVARIDGGTATYEDTIIVAACRLDVLRILLRLEFLAKHKPG